MRCAPDLLMIEDRFRASLTAAPPAGTAGAGAARESGVSAAKPNSPNVLMHARRLEKFMLIAVRPIKFLVNKQPPQFQSAAPPVGNGANRRSASQGSHRISQRSVHIFLSRDSLRQNRSGSDQK
jgi:hypothetical protein